MIFGILMLFKGQKSHILIECGFFYQKINIFALELTIYNYI